ncbi:Diaminopimelate epimerase [Candidatus Rhodobacter oscarellae]|uniref:Diaminopimelate epimerase n=1 Tax=Candidatus Rhodobacter oscarellae TaxID=1675527 RepID=A0A0J9EDI0_9RHOB|nr:diaminopimelate epimerase [Candidatus Rhodobacter lobularis]KMW60731.1 Diaminopimelate epimerase [Candidatus Rhodobacter lobularis]
MRDLTPNGDLPFMKMHGLGNDFVVLDARARAIEITPALARAIGDRHRGIGFDQLAVIRPSADALAELVFYNQDGSTAGACGNATRCIARHLMEETGQATFRLKTERGLLDCADAGQGLTSVNMGRPLLDWRDVPLSRDTDTLHLPIEGDPVATGMGNPHCSFFVDDAEAVDLETRGAEIEHHPLYPQRTNVQFASLIAPNHLRMRVWERGVGVTLASGSSSCAVAVAAHRRGIADRKVRLTLDGGDIEIDWRDDGVWMTGATMHVADGTLTADFLALASA